MKGNLLNSMIKFVFISLFFLFGIASCKYCKDDGLGYPKYSHRCTYYISFADSSQRFSKILYSDIHNYTFDSNSISFDVTGFEKESTFIVEHKGIIDTILFSTVLSDIQYINNSCYEKVYFNIEGLQVNRSSFDSVGFIAPKLIIY